MREKKQNSYHRDFCNKSGHAADYCYSNSKFIKYKEQKVEEKPNIQLHTTVLTITNETTDRFYYDVNMFVGDISPYPEFFECASGKISITGIGRVKSEATETVFTTDKGIERRVLN